jgi:hypothetical protein
VTSAGLAVGQVAEVLVERPDRGYGFGSGYRIGARLVLTVRHLFTDGGTVEVRLGSVGGLYPRWR